MPLHKSWILFETVEYRARLDGRIERITVEVLGKCKNGHDLISENFRLRKSGNNERATCLTCERDRSRKYKNVKTPRKDVINNEDERY